MHDDEDTEPVSYVRYDIHEWLARRSWRSGFTYGICVGALLLYAVDAYRSLIS